MSYTWRSVLKGIQLLKKGIIWRIGDGRSVHIWNVPWIPRGTTRRTCSHRGRHLLQWVNELIDPATGQWDRDLVSQTFHQDDVQIILSIPLVPDMEDFIAWHYDLKGRFSVKSAYKVYIDNELEGYGSSDGVIVHHPAVGSSFPWKKIWELECPNKVKFFAWRLAHNSLPLKRRIESRGVELDTKCPRCLRLDEDAGHLLFKCKYSKSVWQQLHMEEWREKLGKLGSGKDVFRAIWECSPTVQTKLITIFWVIWSVRNLVNAGERQSSTEKTCYQILRHISEFQLFCNNEISKLAQEAEKWKKPADGFLKANIDGAFFQQKKSGGWGFCIRDTEGDPVGMGAGRIETVLDASHTEAQACLQAIQFAIDAGIQRIVLETDCLLLKIALSSNDYDDAQDGNLFREIKYLLRLHFAEFKVVHCSRTCNGVADKLANIGAKMNEGEVMYWSDEIPDDVMSYVAADLIPASV